MDAGLRRRKQWQHSKQSRNANRQQSRDGYGSRGHAQALRATYIGRQLRKNSRDTRCAPLRRSAFILHQVLDHGPGFRASSAISTCGVFWPYRSTAPGNFILKRLFQMPTELITLQQFRDVPEALLAKGKLESAGIACVLADGNLVRMDWLLSNAIGGIRLQVHQQDAAFARELSWTSPSRQSSARRKSANLTPSRAALAVIRSTSASKKLIASGLSVCGCCCSFPCRSEKTAGSATPVEWNGWMNERAGPVNLLSGCADR